MLLSLRNKVFPSFKFLFSGFLGAGSLYDKFRFQSFLSFWMLKMKLCLLVVVVVYCFRYTSSEEEGVDVSRTLLTSYANLMKLYYIEEECMSNVDLFLREELAHHGDQAAADAAHDLTSVRKLVEEAKRVHRQVGSGTKEYLSHPVNVFHLIQRLTKGWRTALHLVRNSKACKQWHIPGILSRLANMEDNLPTDNDLEFLALNLLTIQHMQGIQTQDFIRGKMGPHLSLSPISPQEQFWIAKLAAEEGKNTYVAQWLKHLSRSEKRLKERVENDPRFVVKVLGTLASTYFKLDMLPEALQATNELLQEDPDNSVARLNKRFYEERLNSHKKTSQDAKDPPTHPRHDDLFRKKYEALCRGTFMKLNRHKCRLVPSWINSKISFHKMEVLRRKPPIMAFHDVISRADLSVIVEVSEEVTEQSAMDTEAGFTTPNFTVVLSEVKKSSKRLSEIKLTRYHRLVDKMRNKLSTLPFTVHRPYSPGELETRNFGHNGLCFKPSPGFKIKGIGGHTATAMVFLNDVDMGGEVVFPQANTRVQPQTGSVLFYFPSFGKWHAICPVAYGTEWVLLRSYWERPSPVLCRLHEDPRLQ